MHKLRASVLRREPHCKGLRRPTERQAVGGSDWWSDGNAGEKEGEAAGDALEAEDAKNEPPAEQEVAPAAEEDAEVPPPPPPRRQTG